ncbi:hypothetical protein [Cellulomonas sp. Leaf334]|uniref:hypothetical protein n=1 Tax=Cellulomonas sp. Leaf334 TaxID=1736339 RepID=UPI0006F1EFA9|nr:hypothetical protein [Cellulomonas sp. Leaf334]KQR16829.1 hypothetical protein ASF78_05675 [Cellulomonas sp. Leaf334]
MPHRRRAVVVVATLAVLVGGCTPSAPWTTPGTAEPSASTTTRTPVRTPRPPGPLWSYLEQVDAVSQENEARMHRESEDVIAECMADEGFEYWPREQPAEWDESEQYTLEYARQYGYGSTTTVPEPELSEADRKNEEYRRSLSASAATTYDQAMWDHTDSEGNPAGCTQDAWVAVYQESNWQEDPAFADLHAQFEAWLVAMLQDPRMTEAATDWSACMAEAGYDLATPSDAQDSVMGNGVVTPERDAKEIDTAVADLTCQLETDYQTSMLAAQHVMEQEFVDAHRDQLEALVDAHALEQD